MIAVSELVVNVFGYAGGTGVDHLAERLRRSGRRDSQQRSGTTREGAPQQPTPGYVEGRGLWLARLLCEDLEVVSGPAGVTVGFHAMPGEELSGEEEEW